MDVEKMQLMDAAMRDLLALQGAEPGSRAALAGMVGWNTDNDDYRLNPDEDQPVCMVFGLPLAVLEKAGALSRAIKEAGPDTPLESLVLRASALGCGVQTWEETPENFPLNSRNAEDSDRIFQHGDAYAAMLETECAVLEPKCPLHSDADLRLKVDSFGVEIGYPLEFGAVTDCRLTVPLEDVREILDLCRRPAMEEAEDEGPRP